MTRIKEKYLILNKIIFNLNHKNMNETLEDLAGNDIIDSRDLVRRYEELKEERADLLEVTKDLDGQLADAREQEGSNQDLIDELAGDLEDAVDQLDQWDDENSGELDALESIIEEGSGYGEFEDGTSLINESYFVEYARQLADDIGAVNNEAHWPNDHIDWESAAEDLKTDYTTLEIESDTYYYRV